MLNKKFFFSFLIFLTYTFPSCSKENSSFQIASLISNQNKSIDFESCPPCEIIASKTDYNVEEEKWKNIKAGKVLKINDLTKFQYELAENAYPNSYWDIDPWWMNYGVDPWSEYPYWGNDYVQPNHNFKDCVDDKLRWMCGYSFIVETPENYSPDNKYPLVIFLHGSVVSNAGSFEYRETTRTSFYKSSGDPYVYAAPIKLEIDWDSKKISDMIQNIKNNLNIDDERIYLTGLSMGGRGSFIVAADLPETFAAIMPLSPHHGPYSYVPLAKKVKDIPVWMSHGQYDNVSSYYMAKEMADSLTLYGAEIIFKTLSIGHWGWNQIYSDSDIIEWLMSWKK
jgi:predicted esterase|tara:strand:+ start:120 stop:1133 length:1014 start_codon:yes stop_codon:yes gene_type:complete